MGAETDNDVVQLLIVGMLSMFIMGLVVILFFVTYQKRLLKQQQAHQQKEADYQQQLLRANFLSQEKERNRIGRDLHDEVGALLTTTKLYFQHLDQDTRQEKFGEVRSKAFDLLEESIATVRRVSHDLRPVVLERLGLVEAIFNTVDQINDSDEIEVKFIHSLTQEIDDEYALNWYRIVQELFNNTLKHAQATQVVLDFQSAQNEVIVTYSDNGVGLSGNKNAKEGLGIQNIQSRIGLMKGEIEFGESLKKGFSVKLKSRIKP